MAKVAISRSKLWKSKSKFKGKVRRYGGVRRPLSNKFVFRRAGQEQTIQNTGPGTIALTNTGINGWAVSTPAADANNLFQFGMAFQGRLDQCQAFTDFTTLFDRYKISGIKVKFIPLTTQATLNTAVPMLAYAIDLDDASVPGSYAELNQKYNVRKKRLDKPVSIYLKPRVAASVYNGLGSGYAVGKPMYIDCNNTAVPHYGLKCWFRDVSLSTNTTNTVIRMETTYYLSMKDSQ